MKTIIAFLLIALAVAPINADDSRGLPSAFTWDGVTYRDVKWGHVVNGKVSLEYSNGSAIMMVEDFPPQIRSRLLGLPPVDRMEDAAKDAAKYKIDVAETFFTAKNGDLQRLKQLLKENPELAAARDGRGETALFVAARARRQDVVAVLSEYGADIHATERNGDTPVDIATASGHFELARFLTSQEKEANAKSPEVEVVTSIPSPKAEVVTTAQANKQDSVNLAELIRNPSEWPKEVTLTAKSKFPIVVGGKESGSAELPSGTKLRLIEVKGELVKVAFGESTSTIPTQDTDLLARVIQSHTMKGAIAKSVEQAQANQVQQPIDKPAKAQPVQQDVIGIRVSDVFNIKHRADGSYSANVTTEGNSTRFVVFEPDGLPFMQRCARRADGGLSATPNILYGIVKPDTIVNDNGVQTDDTALHLIGSTTFKPLGAPVHYSW